ncbi:MAG: hypothetical protein ACXVNN_08175 [Bacteroidia bacterium]
MKVLFTNKLQCLKNYILFLIFFYGINSCTKNLAPNVIVHPKDFKIQIPVRLNEKGIIITTYWGKDSIEHLLYWDNHSPSWADFNIIKDTASLKKSEDYNYRTTTADGTPIQGNVYMCDKISLGNVSFSNIPFYNIVHQANKRRDDKIYCVFGEELIDKGIWKIDFNNETITFTSSLDSLKELSEANVLPSRFNDGVIKLDVLFQKNIRKTLEVDMGYNLEIFIPIKLYSLISTNNKRIRTDTLLFSTPGGSENVLNHFVLDSIKIGKKFFPVSIASNQPGKEMLIGAGFFKQFEFVIFDYINQAVYVSKKKLY